MCESTVVLLKGGKRESVMEEVVKIIFSPESITLMDILGEKKELTGVKIIEANLISHEIILEEL